MRWVQGKKKKSFSCKKTAAYKNFSRCHHLQRKWTLCYSFIFIHSASFVRMIVKVVIKQTTKKSKNKNGNSSKWLKEIWWRMNTTQSWSIKLEEAGHEKWIAIIGRNIIWWWSSLYYSMIEISIEKKWMYHAYFSFIALNFLFYSFSLLPSDIASADVIYS